MQLSEKEVKELVENKEMEMGEDFFEYHDLNTDSVRDVILVELKKHLSETEYNEVVEEDVEMFDLRNLYHSIESLFNISEERQEELENVFFASLTKLLNSNEEMMQKFLDSLKY